MSVTIRDVAKAAAVGDEIGEHLAGSGEKLANGQSPVEIPSITHVEQSKRKTGES